MIPSYKLEKIARIGGMACEASGDSNFANIILSEIEQLLDADGAIFYDMSGPFARPVFGESYYHKLDRYYGDLYSQHYNSLDPCFQTLSVDGANRYLSTASTQRANRQRAVSNAAYEHSEYYQDFLKPQFIHSSIIFTLKTDENLLGLFGFQRPKNRAVFDEDSHLLVRLISAPILQALELRRTQSQADIKPLTSHIGILELTPRQMDIARLITLGLSNNEIAQQLQISIKTVENHLTQIYAQTGAKNRVTLAQALSALLQNASGTA